MCAFIRICAVQRGAVECPAAAPQAQPVHHPPHEVPERAPERRRGEVVDEGVQAHVESAGEHGVLAPRGALPVDVAHHMRQVVGPEADDKHQHGSHSQADGPVALTQADVGQPRQDADEVDVAE